MKLFNLFLFSLLLMISCAKSERITVLSEDSDCGVEESKFVVTENNDNWKSKYHYFLKEYPTKYLNEDEVGIFIFLGTRPSNGFRIEFVKSEEKDNRLLIFVKEIIPKEGEGPLTVLTYPCIALKVHKTDKSIEVVYIGDRFLTNSHKYK